MSYFTRLLTFGAITAALFLGSESLSPLTKAAQSFCQTAFSEVRYSMWKSALICGTPLNTDSDLVNLKELGLIHLIVVSGAHLIFLENFLLTPFLRYFPTHLQPALRAACLISYSFFAGLQAPLVRALFQMLCFKTSSQRISVSAILCALFFREISLSLTLSWACALLMSWPTMRTSSSLSKSVVILAGLYPLLLPLGAPSLAVALVQPFFSGLFGAVIFPLTATSLILPIEKFVDLSWEFFFVLLEQSSFFYSSIKFEELNYFSSVIFIFLLQVFYWRTEVHELRLRIFGNEDEHTK